MSSAKFDYVIVGGGLAGLVVASRLAEDLSSSVAVIEAGTDASQDINVKIPGKENYLFCLQYLLLILSGIPRLFG